MPPLTVDTDRGFALLILAYHNHDSSAPKTLSKIPYGLASPIEGMFTPKRQYLVKTGY